jgi:hypothetical protein
MKTREEVFDVIAGELEYQQMARKDDGFPDQEKAIAHWLLYIERYTQMAKDNVMNFNRVHALHNIRKIAALCVRCMEIKGAPQRQPDVKSA